MIPLRYLWGCVITLALLTPIAGIWAQDDQATARPVLIEEDAPKSDNPSTEESRQAPGTNAQREPHTSSMRTEQGGLKGWLCSLFEVKCTNFPSTLIVRKSSEINFGTELARFDRRDNTEEVLWACKGCTSPLVLNENHIAVVKQDGIYMYDLINKEARLITPSGTQEMPVIETLLGLSSEQGWIVVAIRLTEENNCQKFKRYSVALVEIISGKIRKPENQPEACLELSLLLGERFNNNQISGDQVLAQETGTQRKLLLSKVGSKGTASYLMPESLAEDGSDRFDPVWAGPEKVVYIKNSLISP